MKYARMIDARLPGNVLQNTTQIFSAPEHISAGQAWGPEDLTGYLTRVGYRPIQDENAIGQFTVRENTVDIRPSKLSYFAGSNALAVQFRGKSIRSIKPLSGGTDLDTAEIEPELITNLFDSAREKRRPVRYEDLPVMLVDAILSAEDKRFFEHGGFDFIRIAGAAWADLRHTSQHYQGASTITMQVARTFFLSTERNWRRKVAEAMISVELEQRFNKQQIFELYANEVYLGNRGSFGIRGFSEASVAYFERLREHSRVYTTLDPALQRAAVAAIDAGMKNVDVLLAKKYEKWKRDQAKKGGNDAIPQAQVALVALDPRTGEIKAVIGGRDYGQSQLNHALARRQPGSVFKPFVYAAAFDNAVDNVQPIITPATTIDDEPTTFEFDGKEYTPNNYGEKFMGRVTVRDALTNSLNVATVKVAELIGYGRVVQVARKMGLGTNIQPTPAVALGAYEMTPIDVAAAYTTFATMGTRAEPQFLHVVVNADGTPLEKFTPQTHLALDPRVTFLVDSLLKDVLNRGTGAGVRARGFTLPAAGKTGTSRDGWFAGSLRISFA